MPVIRGADSEPSLSPQGERVTASFIPALLSQPPSLLVPRRYSVSPLRHLAPLPHPPPHPSRTPRQNPFAYNRGPFAPSPAAALAGSRTDATAPPAKAPLSHSVFR